MPDREDFMGVLHPEDEFESRWCEKCQRYQLTWDDECVICGRDT